MAAAGGGGAAAAAAVEHVSPLPSVPGDGWAHAKKGHDDKTLKENWSCNYCGKTFVGRNVTRVSLKIISAAFLCSNIFI